MVSGEKDKKQWIPVEARKIPTPAEEGYVDDVEPECVEETKTREECDRLGLILAYFCIFTVYLSWRSTGSGL